MSSWALYAGMCSSARCSECWIGLAVWTLWTALTLVRVAVWMESRGLVVELHEVVVAVSSFPTPVSLTRYTLAEGRWASRRY